MITEGEDLGWSAKCLIFDDAGRVMLVESADRGTWDFPGGHGQNSESPIEALKREVFEEVGLKIDQIEEIGQIQAETKRYLFSAMNFSGSFDLQFDEISDYLWAPVEELIIEVEKNPKNFAITVVLALKNYTKEIRELGLESDKIEYYAKYPRYNAAHSIRETAVLAKKLKK